MFGLAAPAYGAAKLLNKYFLKLEEHILENQAAQNGTPIQKEEEDEEDGKIFHDQLDEALAGKKD